MSYSNSNDAESEAVIRRLLSSYQERARVMVDELLEKGEDPQQVLRLAGFEDEPPEGFVPSREVLELFVTGRLLAEVDTADAPEEAEDVLTSLAQDVYVAGMQKMADQAAAYAQALEAAALPHDSQVESALDKPGLFGRKAERVIKERGYVLASIGSSLWAITNKRSDTEVGIVRGGAKEALGWLHQHAWPDEWIDEIQPDLGRPEGFTQKEVQKLLWVGVVGVYHGVGPEGQARGTQYFSEAHTEGDVIQANAARLLLQT